MIPNRIFTVKNVGQFAKGLGFSKERNSFFTVGKGAINPYYVTEFNLQGETVQQWGGLNLAGTLNIQGAAPEMRGVWIEDRTKKVHLTFGSFYAGADNPCYAVLDYENQVLSGPFRTDLHSDLTKGSMCETPCELLRATGMKYMGFGDRGATAQQQSWGPGLCLINDLQSSPYLATKVIHWPMIPSPTPSCSNFPRPESARWITGPATAPVYKDFSTYCQSDNFGSVGHWKDHVTYLASWAEGYSWYGGPNLYPNHPSLLDPTKPMVSVNFAQGIHCERYKHQLAMIKSSSIIEGMQTANHLIEVDEYIDLQISNKFVTGKVHVDNTLYVLTTGGAFPTIHEFLL